VILHDGRKTIQNVFFPISLKKEQNLVSLKTKKKTGGLFLFWKNNGFF